ncbi:hypothetical protein M3Y99_00938800 [Aphelenchoides fujianensis]|nr:hypothetical protein M3Y99_00938800 [Aphelenchoides fujianensis]
MHWARAFLVFYIVLPSCSALSPFLLQRLAKDPVMAGGFKLEEFLCGSCRQLVSVGEHFVQHNHQNNSGLAEFLNEHKYVEGIKEACRHEFSQTNAKAGRFFACDTVLGAHLDAIAKKIVEAGTNLSPSEICYEHHINVCL